MRLSGRKVTVELSVICVLSSQPLQARLVFGLHADKAKFVGVLLYFGSLQSVFKALEAALILIHTCYIGNHNEDFYRSQSIFNLT